MEKVPSILVSLSCGFVVRNDDSGVGGSSIIGESATILFGNEAKHWDFWMSRQRSKALGLLDEPPTLAK
jgi:hypothetical protein